jgi:acetyltransferase-like isoleucine patch superfamily enzyme
MGRLIEHGFFIFKFRLCKNIVSSFRKLGYKILGMEIGNGTYMSAIYTTYPNQVSIGKKCILEPHVYFKYVGVWKKGKSIFLEDEVFIGDNCEFNITLKLVIGKYSNIASGCKFIDHDHGIKAGMQIGPQIAVEKEIVLGNDVWLGCNVVVLKGVVIGSGAVVAAGAVVTKSIPANEIWGGVPAKKIGVRS